MDLKRVVAEALKFAPRAHKFGEYDTISSLNETRERVCLCYFWSSDRVYNPHELSLGIELWGYAMRRTERVSV